MISAFRREGCFQASISRNDVASGNGSAMNLETAPLSSGILGGSWYLLTNYDCTYNPETLINPKPKP